MHYLLDLLEPLQIWLFQALVLPFMYEAGLMTWADSAFDATGIFLLALLQIAVVYALLRPLELWYPAEAGTRDGHEVRTDVYYTLFYRTGALPLLFFVTLGPAIDAIQINLRARDIIPPNLEDLLPGLNNSPLLAFACYVIAIDFFEYWRHRFQHQLNWWWALHAVHHSQQQLSLWTDERNHLVDGLIQSVWMATVAQIIGVPGTHFIGIVFLVQLVESLSHTNVRLHFGRWFGLVLVSPCYHRLHHGIGIGHEGHKRGCNFATLFPLWDRLFGTANFSESYPRTGIRDQLDGVNYGRGLLEQQLLGISRLLAIWHARKQATGNN
ncbi:MAG: sterol desaturase family protein [Gammaproteobacteria bacterium]|nr:sterol desaturase family protein [Gammaproteobacteria bacterium]